jgi:choline monooxygenase
MSCQLRELVAQFDPTLPLDRARTIPALWYTDPEMAFAECRYVFGNAWQAVGRLDQLPNAGSFFTTQVNGEPILVLRDGDGTLRAFANVCRHRAARVAPQPCGHVTRLRCPYHGWTYDLTGRLRGTPEFDGVADFARDDNGLSPFAVAVWGPLVWVHLGQNPTPLADYLAPLPDQAEPSGLEGLQFVAQREYDLACNWKIFMDNYLDGGYHVNAVHPGLAGVLDYSEYRTEVFRHCSLQSSPLKSPGKDGDAQTVGKVRSGGRACYWWVFPNLMLNVYPGVMDTNRVLPLGPDRCRVIFDFYFANVDGPEAEKFIADSIAVAHQVQLEDMGICEDVQRGLGSRFFDTGRFSVRREMAGHHFHRLLAQHLRNGV